MSSTLRRRPRPMLLFLSALLGSFIGLSAYTFHYARGTSYLSNDPKTCANCHVMQPHYDGWTKSSHHTAATCNDCHVPHDVVGKYLAKLENGYHHSKAFTLMDFHEPIRIKQKNHDIVQSNCLRCHQTMVGEIVGHTGVMAQANDCARCHADVGHGRGT